MTDDEGSCPEEEMGECESGPFCRHWSTRGDCDDLCQCGHTCNVHPEYESEDDSPCNECDCENFVDADERKEILSG